MKRLITMLCVMLGLWSFASADAPMDAEVEKVLYAAYPGYEIIAGDQWGTAAAAALGKGDERVLCVVEEYNDLWRIVIDNPTALRKGETPSILMDTDISLFWQYSDGMRFSSYKQNGLWGPVQCSRISGAGERLWEVEHRWSDGLLYRTEWEQDSNENILSTQTFGPVPAAWLKRYALLTNFDCTVFPLPGDAISGWLSREVVEKCAQEVYPSSEFVDGAAVEDGLELIKKTATGKLQLIAHAYVNDTPVTCISSPLPEGTTYGCENFTTVLNLPTGLLADVAHNGDGSWRVNYTWPNTAESSPMFFGRNWVAADTLPGTQRYVGDHPWGDVTTIDWMSLPATLEDALASMDATRWAVVNNPNPADRLHLRERADKSSRSQGKYYNGTPVEVLEKGKTWTKVRVANSVVGWMMTDYLAFAEDGWKVQPAFPQLHFVEGAAVLHAWTSPKENYDARGQFRQVERSEDAVIIGIVGDEWYHIWFPENMQGGYMKQSDFWAGNG